MAASKRDFTDFRAFPGAYDPDKQQHIFPTLWHKDTDGRWRFWQIQIRLVEASDQLTGIDWDLDVETVVDILDSYYNIGTTIDEDIHAEVWAEGGIEGGKTTRQVPTYITTPVNEGKSNERNVFQQALITARTQFLKKKEKGSTESKKEKKLGDNVNVMYFPMLAKAEKDGKKHLEYPLYIQPKLDGVRCLAFLSKAEGSVADVIIYTRTRKPFPSVDYLKKILHPYLKSLYDVENDQSIYLDGELYKHGKSLQEISGESRNEKSANVKNRNEYHIYDCFYPKELDTDFEDRHEQLLELYQSLTKKDRLVIKEVPTKLVKNLAAVMTEYKRLTDLGYEGAILRNVSGPYLANPNKTGTFMRSNDLVKLKPKFTDEFEVVGYTEGSKGKDKGAVIWICQTANGIKFNVTPKDITYTERYALFEECKKSFNEKYLSHMLTVEYEDLSEDSVPLRAKAIVFRDYE